MKYYVLFFVLWSFCPSAWSQTNTTLPFTYLHQVLGNDEDSSHYQLHTVPQTAIAPYNMICTVSMATNNGNVPSYLNLLLTTKSDTMIYSIHHSARLIVPPGSYTVCIQRQGMGYIKQSLDIGKQSAYSMQIVLQPRKVIMDIKFACQSKGDIKKLIRALEKDPNTAESQCDCVRTGLIVYD